MISRTEGNLCDSRATGSVPATAIGPLQYQYFQEYILLLVVVPLNFIINFYIGAIYRVHMKLSTVMQNTSSTKFKYAAMK
jgi:hypothetical protein